MKYPPLLFAVLALTALSAAGADEFNVYKWVDENGVPQYTDRPPNIAEAQATGIRSRRTDPAAVMARTDEQADQQARQAESFAESADEAASDAEQRAQTLDERRENCERAKERAETYSTAQRLYRPMPGGGREYLTDDELSNARDAANQAVNTWCD